MTQRTRERLNELSDLEHDIHVKRQSLLNFINKTPQLVTAHSHSSTISDVLHRFSAKENVGIATFKMSAPVVQLSHARTVSTFDLSDGAPMDGVTEMCSDVREAHEDQILGETRMLALISPLSPPGDVVPFVAVSELVARYDPETAMVHELGEAGRLVTYGQLLSVSVRFHFLVPRLGEIATGQRRTTSYVTEEFSGNAHTLYNAAGDTLAPHVCRIDDACFIIFADAMRRIDPAIIVPHEAPAPLPVTTELVHTFESSVTSAYSSKNGSHLFVVMHGDMFVYDVLEGGRSLRRRAGPIRITNPFRLLSLNESEESFGRNRTRLLVLLYPNWVELHDYDALVNGRVTELAQSKVGRVKFRDSSGAHMDTPVCAHIERDTGRLRIVTDKVVRSYDLFYHAKDQLTTIKKELEAGRMRGITPLFYARMRESLTLCVPASDDSELTHVADAKGEEVEVGRGRNKKRRKRT